MKTFCLSNPRDDHCKFSIGTSMREKREKLSQKEDYEEPTFLRQSGVYNA